MAALILHNGLGERLMPRAVRKLPAPNARQLLEKALPFLDDQAREKAHDWLTTVTYTGARAARGFLARYLEVAPEDIAIP